MRRRLAAVLGAASAVAALTFGSTAQAGNFGSLSYLGDGYFPPSSVNLANNSTHYYRYYFTDAPRRSATDWAVQNNYYNTGLSHVQWPDATSSSDRNHDVMIVDGDYGDNGSVAWNQCPAGAISTGEHPNRTCYGQLLRYNLFFATAWDSSTEARRTACHEMGHTVGLQHTSDTTTCMRYRYPLESSYFNSHDKAHLNARY